MRWFDVGDRIVVGLMLGFGLWLTHPVKVGAVKVYGQGWGYIWRWVDAGVGVGLGG